MKCISCDEEIDENQSRYIEGEGDICDSCLENDEQYASHITFYNAEEMDGYDYNREGGEMCLVGEYVNHTRGEFKEEYVRLDGWRGYSVVKSDNWTAIHEDVDLMGSDDSKNLAEFSVQFKTAMNRLNIPYAIAICGTSNCCSTNKDFFVKNEDVDKVKVLVENLKELHRDPQLFMVTALTGKSAKDQTPEDKLFALFAGAMHK